MHFQTASAAVHCRPGCFPGTAVAVEAAPASDIAAAEDAPAGAEIHPMDFLGIVTAACCVGRHLLGLRRAACTCPVERVCLRCRFPCRVLFHKVGVRRGVERTLVAVVASTAEGLGAVLAIAAWGLPGDRACFSPYSWVGDSTFVEAALASGEATATEFAAHLLQYLRAFPPPLVAAMY